MKKQLLAIFVTIFFGFIIMSAVSAANNAGIDSKTKVSTSTTYPNVAGKWVGSQNTYGIEKYKISYDGVQTGNQIKGKMKYTITWSVFQGNVGKTGYYKVTGTVNPTGKFTAHLTLISGPSNFGKSNDATWQLSANQKTMNIKGPNYAAVLNRVYPNVAGTWVGSQNTYGIEKYKIKYVGVQTSNQVKGTMYYTITWSVFKGNVGKTGAYKITGSVTTSGKYTIYKTLIYGPSNFAKSGSATWQLSNDGKKMSIKGPNYTAVLNRVT